MDSQYDVVIIGSGLGGLLSGAILSKYGYNVCVLEQHSVIGGCLQSFKRFGIQFDTGMHYIGSVGEGQPVRQLFDWLKVPLHLQEMDRDGYDKVEIDGVFYPIASGDQNFVDRLAEYFPDSRNDLARYIKYVREATDALPLFNFHNLSTDYHHLLSLTVKSYDEVLRSYIKDDKLFHVLTGQEGLFAGKKGVTPFFTHLVIAASYTQGAYRFVGGSQHVADGLADLIRKNGGVVRTRAKVASVDTDGQMVTSVTLESGEQIACKYAISDIHPQLLLPMVKGGGLRKIYCNRVNAMKNTYSSFTVNVRFKDNTVPYERSNYVCYGENYSKDCILLFEATEENEKYAKGGILVVYMEYNEVEQWKDSTLFHRPQEYLDFKQKKAEEAIEKMYKHFPQTRGNVQAYNTCSPLTYRDYTGTIDGCMYGIQRDIRQPMGALLTHKTSIPNLILSGQNTYAHGMFGVSVGSLMACGDFIPLPELVGSILKG